MGRDRAQPEIGTLDAPKLVVLEEVDGGVEDRALSVMRLQGGDEDLRLGPDVLGAVADAASGRGRGPFHIEDRRQGSGCAGDMGDEPAGLLDGGAAVVEEMIGAARDAGAGRALPVLIEQRVGLIAAFGRLDEGKADAVGLRGLPIDGGLEF